jgi:MFS family permease
VRWQALTGVLAQTTQGAGGIGIILVIRGEEGSLALAGAVVGVLSVAAGLARPVQGRLIDRRGARGLMAACGVIHSSALAGIVVLADGRAPAAALLAAAVLAGITLPPVSTCMRVVWGMAVGGGDRTSAYSLVYLTQELAILAGPLLLSAMISATDASTALVTVALVACAGTLAFAASVPSRLPRGSTAPPDRGRALLIAPGMPALIGTAVLVGAAIGGVQVGVPTFATAHHAPAASGLLIAALSVGGIAGLVLNPSLTTISLHVDWHVSPASAAEAFGWLSTGIASGTGAANAIAGAATHPGDPRPAFAVATVAAVAGVLLVAVARGRLARGYPR